MEKMFCVYLTPQELAVLQEGLDIAIAHYVMYYQRSLELATIQLRDSLKDFIKDSMK